MVKQVNSGAETEMDGDDMARIMFQRKDTPGAWYFWWHSHANMPVFWSGTDKDQIAKLARNGACVALVLNARGESKCLLAIGSPFLLFVDDVKIETPNLVTEEQKKSWDEEYDAKVSARTYTFPGYGHSYYGDGMSNEDWDDDYWRRKSYGDTYAHPGTSAARTTELSRGSLQGPKTGRQKEIKEVVETEDDEFPTTVEGAERRLTQVHRQILILEFALREQIVNKVVCDICNIEHQDGLELDSPLTGANRGGDTIGEEIDQVLINLYEEEDVLERGLAHATKS